MLRVDVPDDSVYKSLDVENAIARNWCTLLKFNVPCSPPSNLNVVPVSSPHPMDMLNAYTGAITKLAKLAKIPHNVSGTLYKSPSWGVTPELIRIVSTRFDKECVRVFAPIWKFVQPNVGVDAVSYTSPWIPPQRNQKIDETSARMAIKAFREARERILYAAEHVDISADKKKELEQTLNNVMQNGSRWQDAMIDFQCALRLLVGRIDNCEDVITQEFLGYMYVYSDLFCTNSLHVPTTLQTERALVTSILEAHTHASTCENGMSAVDIYRASAHAFTCTKSLFPVVDLNDLGEKTDKFLQIKEKKNIVFPANEVRQIVQNSCENLRSGVQQVIEQDAASATVFYTSRAESLFKTWIQCVEFDPNHLLHNLYKEKIQTIDALVHRLVTKRFLQSGADFITLRTGKTLSTNEWNSPSAVPIEEYITGDEVYLASYLCVCSPTFFINSSFENIPTNHGYCIGASVTCKHACTAKPGPDLKRIIESLSKFPNQELQDKNSDSWSRSRIADTLLTVLLQCAYLQTSDNKVVLKIVSFDTNSDYAHLLLHVLKYVLKSLQPCMQPHKVELCAENFPYTRNTSDMPIHFATPQTFPFEISPDNIVVILYPWSGHSHVQNPFANDRIELTDCLRVAGMSTTGQLHNPVVNPAMLHGVKIHDVKTLQWKISRENDQGLVSFSCVHLKDTCQPD